jgi:hypothetical protein
MMDYRPLGKTGLTVSVAGLGCGGNSRLGLGRDARFEAPLDYARSRISDFRQQLVHFPSFGRRALALPRRLAERS